MGLRQRSRAALAALNFDLFAGTSAVAEVLPDGPEPAAQELPSLDELYRLFDRFNWIYFDGALPTAVIEYSSRMTSAGSYTPSKRLIKIGRRYHELFPDEIEDTLKHEMIHIRHIRHDATFRREARRIGASVRARSHPALRRPARYLYVCPACGREYPRQKRLRMSSCGICSGGRYRTEFKLKLKSSAR